MRRYWVVGEDGNKVVKEYFDKEFRAKAVAEALREETGNDTYSVR